MDFLTGSELCNFKGSGSCGPRSLNLLSDDYLVTAEKDSPIINFWALKDKNNNRRVKVHCPSRVSCLTVTSDGGYCAVGISQKCYVWQVRHNPKG